MLQALGDRPEEVLWVGSDGGIETDLVRRAGVPFKSIPAAGLHGRGLKAIGGLWKLTQGYFAARKLIREFKPDVLFFTGGYVAIPTGLAGRKVPTLLCVPDIEPALALRTLARFADQIAVPAPQSLEYFPSKKKVEVVGYPTRQEIKPWAREEAFAAFELSPEKETLLVMGGSLGARSINRALVAALPSLLPHIQIIHLTGQTTWDEVEAAAKALPAELAANYRPYVFLHERMAAAFTAADLVVSRAGASVLGELPAFGLPAILVPYPYAWRYQRINAEYLTGQDAAILLRDEDLGTELLPLVTALLLEEPDRLMRMALEMEKLATPDAAGKIADMLFELAAGPEGPVAQGGEA